MSCIVIDDELHAIEELSDLIATAPNLNLLKTFLDARQAIAYLQQAEHHVDIIFSDVSMGTLNGIQIAEIFNKYCHFLVYVTAYREFAPEAFGVLADGYLLKPLSYIAFAQKVDDLANKFQNLNKSLRDDHQFLFIKGGQKSTYIKIKYSDIIYIEAMLNYIIIHISGGGQEITYIGLKTMEDKLQFLDLFFRISRFIMISLNYVDRIDGNIIRLSTGQSFQIGDKYKAVLLEFLKKHSLKS